MGNENDTITNSRGLSNRGIQARALADPATEKPGKIKEIDEMRASLQTIWQVRIPQYSNAELIDEAKRLDAKLLEPKEDVGELEKAAIAETLIKMHQDMDKRIKRAAAKQMKFLPVLEGVDWGENNPLAGIVEGISPFHMVDWWISHPVKTSTPKSKKKTPLYNRVDSSKSSSSRPQKPSKPITSHLGKILPSPPKPPPITPWEILMSGLTPEWITILQQIGKAFSNWVRARTRGIDEAAHDIAIYATAAGIASMAEKITNDAYASIPEPDCEFLEGRLGPWLMEAGDKEAARRAQAKGVNIGLNAAKDFIKKMNKKAATKEVKGFITSDGNSVICRGLECASPKAIVLVPAQMRGITWLRYLKKQFKTRANIYGHILEKLDKDGVKIRHTVIRQKYRKK